MALIVLARSESFEKHIRLAFEDELTIRSKLTPAVAASGNVYLVHITSIGNDAIAWIDTAVRKGVTVGVASDHPAVEEMLAYTDLGARAYFNAYMAPLHYEQLNKLLSTGQSWYPPELLAETFSLARRAVRLPTDTDPLEKLTHREKEIAIAVSEGKSNKLIATDCDISERTVKTHLTNIFKKLQVKDRVALVIYLNR